MRLLCAAALTLSVGLYFSFADDKKDAKEGERAARLKDLAKKYDGEMAQLFDKFQNAKTAAEKDALRTEAKELSVLSADKALKIAEENPKDDVALDAAVFIVQKPGKFVRDAAEIGKAFDLIAANHINNSKVKDLLLTAGNSGASGEKCLNTIAEKSTNKEVKAVAFFALGKLYAAKVDDADDEKEALSLSEKARRYLDKAVAESSATKVEGKSIADWVKSVILVGNVVPDVAGVDVNAKKVKLSDYKGKVVLFDIWATWCPPCRAMIPHEREMVKKMKDKPFVLVSVSADKEKMALTDFLKDNEMPWVHWWDGGDENVTTTFDVQAFPTLYLIDHKGVIRRKWVGSPKTAVLDEAVEELVREAEKDTKKK